MPLVPFLCILGSRYSFLNSLRTIKCFLSFIHFRDTIKGMEVLLGLDDIDDRRTVTKRNISNVVIHEQFTTTAVRDENDIAIATIDRPVQFNDKMLPICLPNPGETSIHSIFLISRNIVALISPPSNHF